MAGAIGGVRQRLSTADTEAKRCNAKLRLRASQELTADTHANLLPPRATGKLDIPVPSPSMPSKFPWTKSSSSNVQERPVAPQLQVPRHDPYPPNQYPETYYDPDLKGYLRVDPSASSSSQASTHSNSGHLTPIGRGAGANEHQQPYDPRSIPSSPISSDKLGPSSRKNLKTRLGLAPGSSREELQETLKEPSKGIFGRKKSVIRRKEPSASGQEYPNQQRRDSPTAWPYEATQPAVQQIDPAFEPYGPDFTTEQLANYNFPNRNSAYLQTASPIYQNSPVQTSYSGSQPHFEVYSEPVTQPAQASPIRYQAPSRQNSHESPTHRVQQQSNSRPSSRLAQEPYNASQQSPQLALLEALQQTSQPVQEQKPQQPLQRSTTISAGMAPVHGQRQTRRQSQQGEQMKASLPQVAPRETSNLHPPSSASPALAKQLSQSTQSSREGDATTPPASTQSRSSKDMSDLDVQKLLKDHTELKSKYNNVKRQYFDKKDQVEQLQTSLATQRLSQSRTCLDDGEYITRMTRLDGLVAQLAFGIRKEWKTIPDWLLPSVNKDALQIAKQEMTVVGRTVVSRWLADEFFNKYFHPAIDTELSVHLKTIQKNIWSDAAPFHTTTDEESLVSKIIAWRLATVEGLKSHILVPEASSLRMSFADLATQQLVAELQRYLQPSGSAGLEGGIRMIIELAVSILANLPLESRDVCIEYFHPSYPFLGQMMKAESGIPPLPGSESTTDGDRGSLQDSDAGSESHEIDDTNTSTRPAPDTTKKGGGGGGGFFGFGGGGGSGAKKARDSPRARSPQKQQSREGAQTPREDRPGTVRMCAFLALHIRGKMVLAKAPVFRM